MEGGLPALDEDTLEAPFPERAGTSEAAIEEDGDALLEFLEKDREVAAPSLEAFEDLAFPGRVVGFAGGFELGDDGLDGGLVVEKLEERDEGLWGQPRNRIARGNLDEEVEVIAHEAVGGNADRAEGLEFAKDRAEDLLFARMENDALVDDAGNTMIEGAIRRNDA